MPMVPSTRARSALQPSAREAESIGTDDASAPDEPSEDEVFDVLGSSRRRDALRHLDANGGEATIETLAEHVAAVENGVDREAIAPAQRKRAYIALYQCHLPKMADYGVIEYERERGIARLRGPALAVLPHLHYRRPERPSETDAPSDPVASVWRRVRRLLGR